MTTNNHGDPAMINLETKIKMNKEKIKSIKDSIEGLVIHMESLMEMISSANYFEDITGSIFYSSKMTEDSIEINRLMERLAVRELLLREQLDMWGVEDETSN